jgi:ribosome maturation factor RimP
MISNIQVNDILKSILNPDNHFVVEVVVRPGNKIFIAVDGFINITLDECSKISRELESRLDREKEDFELEVSSPGLTEPFKVPEQYKKYENTEVEVLYKSGYKTRGKLLKTSANGFDLEVVEVERDEKTKKKKTTVTTHFIEFGEIKYTKKYLKF